MIIVPEVQSVRNLLERCFFCGGLLLLLSALSFSCFAESLENTNPSEKTNQFQDCNWLVNYRGKTYDLAPLTREALSRPIDTDLRFVLRKVPESANHLESMSKKLKEAKAHTILGSIFATGFLIAKILEANKTDPDQRREYNRISIFAGSFFLGATYQGYRANSAAKEELVNAVEEFNKKSPHKILPGRSESEELEL